MSIEVLVLGRAQDGGMPQAGCRCSHCSAAWAGTIPRELAASLAVIDRTTSQAWMIDAGPDFREQLHLLQTRDPQVFLAGIVITHAHIGHYVGLVHLGREAMGARSLPVHATPRAGDFLRSNGPWSQLVSLENILLHEHEPGSAWTLSQQLTIQFNAVPHRAEFSDTMAIVLRGPSRSLFYCPDIDTWTGAPPEALNLPDRYDLSIIDGTFFNEDELPGVDLSKIPHPTVQQTMQHIGNGRGRVYFTHMNHSNPLLSSLDAQRHLRSRGFDCVQQMQTFEL